MNSEKNNDMCIHFDGISVYGIEASSGIFMGKNYAIGWSAHTKVNTGFGDAGNSKVSNNVNIVFDNDIIDSPIDDRDFIVTDASSPESIDHTAINFNKIDALSLNTNSSISIGENSQMGWDSHGKSNVANGTFFGDSNTSGNVNIVVDNDLVDSPINDQDFKPAMIEKKD